MLFVEPRFLLFFLIVIGVHWALRSNLPRKIWLLIASYVFYAAWDWRFLSLIWSATLINYLVGVGLLRTDRARTRKILVVSGVTSSLVILGFFKYWGFFVESARALLDWLGFHASLTTLEIILPVGISFFTFQAMSYAIDSYRGKLVPTRNLLDVALFIAFFPQLVAGPIVRAADFIPQLQEKRRFNTVNVRAALVFIVVGYVQKAVIADNAGLIADPFFAAPEAYRGGSVFLGVFAYSAQIYGDFAGYSNMAIGLAALLGYQLPLNFNFPYVARNITDFWRRWHISLSTWLRDYLYITLGGNRGSRLFTYRNLMLTMLLGGLWHGAAWRFAIWGGLHGIALVLHREFQRLKPENWKLPKPLGLVFSSLVTFYWVSLAWIFFRAQDLGTATTILKGYLFLGGEGTAAISAHNGALTATWILVILLILAVFHVVNSQKLLAVWDRVPEWAFALFLGAMIPLILALVPPQAVPFIYFQF